MIAFFKGELMSRDRVEIDYESKLFREEFSKTVKFTDAVLKQFNLVYNPDQDINERIQSGLTRNKLIYSKRYCPCFFVDESADDNRICPCKPALEVEIPRDGTCHCQIFCTPEYVSCDTKEQNIDQTDSTSSAHYVDLLQQSDLNSAELALLLEARSRNEVQFKLIDVREPLEYKTSHIVGTDHLVSTTDFYNLLNRSGVEFDEHLIVYCHVGSRSAQVQRIMVDLGYKKVINLLGGIASYSAQKERG